MDVLEYSASFPATADGIRAARLYARAVAGVSPRMDEVEVVAGELASCAVRNAADGAFTLIARRHRLRGWLRLEAVRVQGEWSGGEDGELAHGYGLMIIDSLAKRWGCYSAVDGSRAGATVIWAELCWV